MATLNRNELAWGMLPCLFLLFVAWLLQVTHWDVVWVGRFYDESAHRWDVSGLSWSWDQLHERQQYLTYGLFGSVLIYWLYQLWRGQNAALKRALTYIVVAAASCLLIVGWLKAHTRLPCPLDTVIFGGNVPILGMTDLFNSNWPVGRCFPAAHATSGYALLSLFFAARALNWRHGNWWLLPGLLIGLIFGLTQQMRGMHFPSHDIVALAISWICCWLWALIFFGKGVSQHR